MTSLEAELYGALQNILNGIDTGLVRIDTDADETWDNALARARRAVGKVNDQPSRDASWDQSVP